LNRVSVQKYGFLALGALFIALGTEFITVHQEGALAITLYGKFSDAKGHVDSGHSNRGGQSLAKCFSISVGPITGSTVSLVTKPWTGPNSTTYIIPAELFPTRYRCTCHGIAAASGKLGSILVQVFSFYYKFGSSSPGDNQTKRYGTILVIFSACMILGAAITHFFIPEVQEKAKRGSIWAGK
jgi:hypothetical protein